MAMNSLMLNEPDGVLKPRSYSHRPNRRSQVPVVPLVLFHVTRNFEHCVLCSSAVSIPSRSIILTLPRPASPIYNSPGSVGGLEET